MAKHVLIAWGLLCLAGCQFIPEQTGLLERNATSAQLTSHQLRVMVNEFVVFFADRVERTADSVLAEASDPAIRRSALLWKINSTSAAFQAASRHDSLGAFLDLWVLNRQMTAMVDSELGVQYFGPWQNLALDECHQLDDRLQRIYLSLGIDLQYGEEFVSKFSADFPLTSLYFEREPIASRYIEEVQEPARELMHVIASLDENIDDLRKLSLLFAEHLPKQARWEAELLLMDAYDFPVLQEPLEQLTQATQAVTSLASIAQQFPTLLERERVALHQIVTEERIASLAQVDLMLHTTLKQLEDERKIVLAAVTEEREAVSRLVDEERRAFTVDLNSQLSTAIAGVDTVSRRRLSEAVESSPAMIDHLFWRTFQILGLLAVATAVCLLGVAYLRGRDSTEPVHRSDAQSNGSAVSLAWRKDISDAA